MRERSHRVRPQKAITVAIETPRHDRSYGVVANISTGGACVLTDASLPVGEIVRIELSFFREPETVPATGHIVWAAGNRDAGAVRYGLQWDDAEDARLRSLIEQAEG